MVDRNIMRTAIGGKCGCENCTGRPLKMRSITNKAKSKEAKHATKDK